MVTLTNKFDLPEVVVKAVRNQRRRYSKGEAHFSVTELLSPPYQRRLLQDHAGEVTEDVADALYSMIGSLGHQVFELAAEEDGALHEERLFMPVDGFTISGQMDLIEQREILDFKFTSVEKYMYGDHKEWEQQLNCYRALAAYNKYPIHKLTIIALFRNWAKRMKDDHGYPSYPVVKIDIPMWEKKVAWSFIRERVRLHSMRFTHSLEDIPPCTDEERWTREGHWVAQKPDAKRASRRFTTKEEAEAWVADSKHPDSYEVSEVPGIPVRCASWCAAADFCPAYAEWKQKNVSATKLQQGWYAKKESKQ